MPTETEWIELREQCTWTWTTQNGVNGYKVTGSNGNYIFLPAAGCLFGNSPDGDISQLTGAGYYGDYWSSSGCGQTYVHSMSFYSHAIYLGTDYRSRGQSVRPVREPAPTLDTILSMIENLEYATKQWVEEQGYIKNIPPHTVTINFYNDIDYAVWHNMVGDIEITSMQSTNVLDLYVSDGNNLNKQDVEIALDNGAISITNGSTLTFDVVKTTDANGFAAVTLTYNIK